jgi:hypothetical protein
MTIRQEQLGNITELDKDNTGSIDVNNSRIINVAAPINNNDVATKNYVDTYSGGGGGGSQSLSDVLAIGNTTGDNNIIISDGYKITSLTNLILDSASGSSVSIRSNNGNDRIGVSNNEIKFDLNSINSKLIIKNSTPETVVEISDTESRFKYNNVFVENTLNVGNPVNFVGISYNVGLDAIEYNHTQSVAFGFSNTGTYDNSYGREVIITAQSNDGINGNGGGIYLYSGEAFNANGNGGTIELFAGQGFGLGNGGALNFVSGDASNGNGNGGIIDIWAGAGVGTGNAGDINFYLNSSGSGGNAGNVIFKLTSGDSTPGRFLVKTENNIDGVVEQFGISETGTHLYKDPVLPDNAAHKQYVDDSASFDGSHKSMSLQSRTLQGVGYDIAWAMINTGMTDTNILSSPAGSDLVASTRGIHLVGTLGGVPGQHYSMSFSGLEFGKDFDFTNDVSPSKGNACALIGYTVNFNFFNIWNIASNGVVSNYIYDASHSASNDSNVDETSGGDDWSGARATFLYKNNDISTGLFAATYWTAPNENKVYSETAFFDGLQSTSFSNSPKGICADKDGYLWVSFDNNELIRFNTGNTPLDFGTLTTIKTLQNIPYMVDMIFDGTCIWGVSLQSTYGKIVKINPVSKEIQEYLIPSINNAAHLRSRVVFDGSFIYVGTKNIIYKFSINKYSGGLVPLAGIIPEPGEVRGLTLDKDKNLYAAVMTTSPSTIWICKYYSNLDGNAPTLEEFSQTYVLGNSSSVYTLSPFNFINLSSFAGDTRKFNQSWALEITITAGRHSMFGHGIRAMWKRFYLVNFTGSTNIIHSVDIIPTYKDSVAISEGWNFTLTTSSNNLIGTITHGTNANLTVWDVNIKLMMHNKDLA